jgi:diguanylate cyclase (GGDEF)-like protein/PAS domain S-box-containing protein
MTFKSTLAKKLARRSQDGSTVSEATRKSTSRARMAERVVVVGLWFAAVFWIFQSIVDVVLFQEGSLVEQMLTPGLHDIWMRTLVICTLITFGVYAQSIIAERRRVEEALSQSEERYRTILEEMQEGYFEVDVAGNFTFVNDSTCRNLGYSREEMMGTSYRAFTVQEDLELVYKTFNQAYGTGEPIEGFTWRAVRKDGSTRFFEGSVSSLRNKQGDTVGFRCLARDITEQLKDMATHDALTGLPNRRLFNDRLHMALAQAQRNEQPLAVLMLDLDKFKEVNDTLGHNVGDQLLKAVGKRLVDCLRRNDSVARLGGDEFILLLPQITSMEDGAVVAQKILNVFAKPFVLDADVLNISTSIGVAVYPSDGEDADTLMRNADTAMYCAKRQGRNSYQLCPTEQEEALVEK